MEERGAAEPNTIGQVPVFRRFDVDIWINDTVIDPLQSM